MDSHQTPATEAGRADVPHQRTTPVPSGTVTGPAAHAACQLLGIVRALRARERAYLAAALHDGPIQDLAAATLELSLAGDDLGVPQRQVEAAGLSLRRLVDELAPLPQATAGLAETLIRRTAWLLGAPLAVDLGEGAAGLSAAEIETAADLVELMLFGAVGADAPTRALAAVRADHDLITLELNVTATDPAAGNAWLNRLAAAIQSGPDVSLRGHRLQARTGIPRWPGI
jgi:hypothetical protein